MKRLRNFGKFHVPDNSPLNLCSSPLLHKVAKAQYGQTCQALEWVEATLTRLYMGKVGTVLGGLRRMQATSAEALKAIDNCWVYLNDHRGRTHYGKFRRGGYPLGSGGIESSNTFMCHVRLKRSGAWWYEATSNQMLALRCAMYNGPWIRCLCGTNNGDGQCQNDRMLPMPGSVGWKCKAGAYRHATGSSMGTASRLEGCDER